MHIRSAEQKLFLHRWALVALTLAVVGLALSFYATNHHFELLRQGQTDAACNINATISCDAVASSPYAVVLGWPLGIWGMGFFAAMAVFSLLMRTGQGDTWRNAYIWTVWAGTLVSVILAGIAFFLIGSLCLVCVGIYAVNVVAFVSWLYSRQRIGGDVELNFEPKTGLMALGFSVAFAALGAGIFSGAADVSETVDAPASPQMPISDNAAEITINRTAYSGLGEDYRKGSDEAAVTIVEFADFQCPACKRASLEILKRLFDRFGDQIQIVFKNYPLHRDCNDAVGSALHAEACTAALLARCAGRQGKFWQLHDLIFQRQAAISRDNLKKWAVEVGLQQSAVDQCLKDESLLAKIKDDARIGDQLGIRGTPTLYINGVESKYREYVDLELQVENLLR